MTTASAGAPSAPDSAQKIERRTLDGVEWTFRPHFGPALQGLPAAAWTDPSGQGWQRVKHNATRAVWRARIGGMTYFLKYYVHQRWVGAFKNLWRGPACEIEWKSGVYALAAGIPAVRPVACTDRVHCAGRMCSLLITEAVEPAYSLSRYWETLQADDDPARRRRDTAYLIDLLAEMIARAHQSGFEHRDMHAANILVHPIAPGRYETVFVDLQSARLGTPLSDRAVVRNLAQLNQWFRRHSSIGDRLRFLRRYLRWRNEYEQAFEHGRPLDLSFGQLVPALVEAAKRHAERLWAKRDRRARRSNRYFSRMAIRGGWRGMVFVRCKRPAEESRASHLTLDCDWWRAQLENPLRWFEPETGRPCKQSHSALVTRAVLATDAERLPVIIKRPLARDWRRRLRQLFGPSRSMRGWRIGHALINRDIPAARPLAVLEKRIGPLILDSVLLTEGVPGAVDLEAHLRREYEARSPHGWWRHKRELGDRLVRRLRRLAERGFIHRDCKAQNVLVVAHPRLKLLWIDMDGLKHTRRPSAARQLEALLRLHVSLLDVPGLMRTDRARFLKAYFARFGSDPRAWRGAWRRLSRASAEKTRVKQLRREWKLKHYGRA
jgi:Ser/Thr protein kinase RdoA (MazF antagonist)